MRRFIFSRITPFLAVALFASCGGTDRNETTENEAPQRAKVRVERVQVVPVDQISTFTATVEADHVNNIAPAMGGRIRDIKVDVGARVAKGQALVTMDRANFSQQQTQVTTLQRDYERYKDSTR